MITSNTKVFFLLPTAKSSITSEFESCLTQLNAILNKHRLNTEHIIKQTVFLKAENNDIHRQKCDILKKKLASFYGDSIPPTSFVGQPPENDLECAIELILLKKESTGYRLIRKKTNGLSYTVVEYPSTKEIFACSPAFTYDFYDPLKCSRDAFSAVEHILTSENLSFRDIVRQWNYIEGILDTQVLDDDVRQNYQIFNDVRSLFYSQADFCNGYPAATGIGMNSGGIIIEFIAMKQTDNVKITAIKNPNQIDAHQYSDDVLVGNPIDEISKKTSPKFERAKLTTIDHSTGQVYVSGTAAIIGQKSASNQNIDEQTMTTIKNIQRLISESNLTFHNICYNSCPLTLSHLRAYIKDEKDINNVKKICNRYYPNVPVLYLISDICRDDLLVELEGVANWM